jgi:hypothetical protein
LGEAALVEVALKEVVTQGQERLGMNLEPAREGSGGGAVLNTDWTF